MEFQELKVRVAELIKKHGLSDVKDAIVSYCDEKRQVSLQDSQHDRAEWWRKTREIFSEIQFPD